MTGNGISRTPREAQRCRMFAGAAAMATIALSLFVVTPARAAEPTPPTAEYCLGCHGSAGMEKKLADGGVLQLHIPGETFAKSVHGANGCTSCHSDIDPAAHPPAGKTIASARAFAVAASGTCKTCHSDIQDSFNFTAKADYDGNGKIEGVQDEVKGLLNVLWGALEQSGLKKIDSGYPYATVPSDASDHVKNAWYNYRVVYGVMWGEDDPGNQGAASAIHNFNRSVGLLQASYKDLTGNDVPGATILK